LSDDLNKKIKQITDILGQDSMPDNVKDLISLLTNSNTKNTATNEASKEMQVFKENSDNQEDYTDNMDMVRKIKKVMEKVKPNNDPRINLLTSIKPFLTKDRQSKISQCIKILNITTLSKLIDENDKGIF